MAYTGTDKTRQFFDTLDVRQINVDDTIPVDFAFELESNLNAKVYTLIQRVEQLEEQLKNSFKKQTGIIKTFGGSAFDKIIPDNIPAPEGYEWCFGQIVYKEDDKYKALYSVIGDYWNTSDSLRDDQFQLPDLRNVFLRGCPEYVENSENNRDVGSFQSCGMPEVWAECEPYDTGHDLIEGYLRGALGYKQYAIKGCMANDWGVNILDGFDFRASRCSSVYQDGLTEVRPDNKAVNYIIKL